MAKEHMRILDPCTSGSCGHECPCPCHQFKGIIHVVPCCVTCQVCGRNIVESMLDGHLIECHGLSDFKKE